MSKLICPKCGASYEQHPLDPSFQELCPSCRNKASWEEIRGELANAAKLKSANLAKTPISAPPRQAAARAGA